MRQLWKKFWLPPRNVTVTLRKEKMACLSARGCQDDRCQSETAASSDGGVVGMGGTTELPTFHLHDGGTAISPDFTRFWISAQQWLETLEPPDT